MELCFWFVLMSLGPGTQSLGLGLEHLSLDNKCDVLESITA